MRTPHVAARVVRGELYASAASPYARNAGQKSASTTLSRPLHELGKLPVQPLQLRRDDPDPREHGDEHDEVGGGHVLPLGGNAFHVSSSRSSRRCASMRLPASSTLYSVAKSKSIAANETRNDSHCAPVMLLGACESKTTGWMNRCDRRIARNETGISTTPKSAYTALMFIRGGPASTEKRNMKYAQ